MRVFLSAVPLPMRTVNQAANSHPDKPCELLSDSSWVWIPLLVLDTVCYYNHFIDPSTIRSTPAPMTY
jgi:hypothetical protein